VHIRILSSDIDALRYKLCVCPMFHSFNREEKDFPTLLEYNNYLEEAEDLIYNLTEGIDVDKCNEKLKAYEAANRRVRSSNQFCIASI
jgi:hypothetical protein